MLPFVKSRERPVDPLAKERIILIFFRELAQLLEGLGKLVLPIIEVGPSRVSGIDRERFLRPRSCRLMAACR